MELTKQKISDKVLSFDYPELAEWIKERLQGKDKYFPVYLGHESNLAGFLIDVFNHIKDKKFRDNFLEILGDLTGELRGLGRRQMEESKEYISELLFLCGNIRQFDNKISLLEIAISGDFKGIKIDHSDLHANLLTTLASYHIAGAYRFWMNQFLDESDKTYANPAFYALKDYPEKLFEHISVFIDKFKGKIELILGIMSLIDDFGIKEIKRRFKSIELSLSRDQKEAVNDASVKADYSPFYKLEAEADYEPQYKPVTPRLQYVSDINVQYGAAETLEEKAGKVFETMGFEVEFNRTIAGNTVDIFIRKKKTFGSKYECYICKCQTGNRKTNIKTIRDVLTLLETVRAEFSGCDAVIVSEKGFTKEAEKLAQTHGIELKTI